MLDLESECTGSPAGDGVRAIAKVVERGNQAATPDPDEAGAEEISRELTGKLATRILPGQRKSRSIQR
jgi:hypothetical protein